ncbi:intracellular transport [Trichoderma arundinaceum]|uniref:Intracellular transport n=1 Tax=Trichoderma arundinaceum TaxID=490622 RepID=A0A395NTG4_TRIAR|nr:intracellular transport [Trichoderma arundinaceum]
MDVASQPPSGPGAMASILPDSDTQSASSEVSPPPSPLRHSSIHRDPEEDEQEESDGESQHYHQQDHHQYHHHPQTESNPGTAIATPAPAPIRTSIAASHSRSQTLNYVDTSAPTIFSPVAATSLPFRFSGPIKRKPVSNAAASSSLVSQYLTQGSPLVHTTTIDLPKPDHRFARSPSVDSPTFYEYPASIKASGRVSQLSESRTAPAPSDDETVTASRNNPTHGGPISAETADTELSDVLSEYDDLLSDLTADGTPDGGSVKAQDEVTDDTSDVESIYDDNSNPPPSPPMLAPTKHTPPHLRLEKVDPSINIGEGPQTYIDDSPQSATVDGSPKLNKPLPRSPGATSPLATFFGWGNPSPSVTDFSSIPSPSPLSPNAKASANDNRRSTNSLSSGYTKPNAATTLAQQRESFFSTHSPHLSQNTALVDEMEEELKAISSELAASIRREIDLEDLADRLQEQINNNPQVTGSKRTSDYFSDSGHSTAKLGEFDQGRDEIERVQRKSEQERANLRLELTSKLQEEREKRKELDQKIRQLQERASEVDVVEINNIDASERIKELENICEDLRRKLSEERQSKTNFEDLLAALKNQLQEACDERDNLRDEVIPELKSRVEGLEAEAAEYANLTYESSRMQQELHTLKRENSSLRNSMASGIEDLPTKRMSVIGLSRSNSVGLSRSNSVATGSLRARGPPGIGGLKRSDSFKSAAQTESRETLLERLKDVEAQRDALHSALKSLLERQEFQNREYQKKIRMLETERQRLTNVSPRKAGFEKDMSKLRTEINLLRRRAEDALEQKWQVEKGLGGLKIDLDRAEEEIESLRNLLKENDILIPPSAARLSSSSDTSREPVTSESLRNAYAELQASYAESLERIRQLESGSDSDEETREAMERLERSLSAAVLERDAARREVNQQKIQINILAASEAESIAADGTLAEQLKESADLIEQLTAQVRQQLDTNSELRERLEAAVTRGETDRKSNSQRISELQERLRVLEDQVVTAQTASEDRIVRHEEEISRLREAHNEQLRRLQADPSDSSSHKSGPKPLLSTRPIPAKSLEEEADMKTLRAHVLELEKALAEAEDEMQEVVARMNMAQVEVLNLQEAREAAVRETRRLEDLLKKEQSKAGFGGFFSARN